MNKTLLSCIGLLLYGCSSSNIPSNTSYQKYVENEIEDNPKPDPQANLEIKCETERLHRHRKECIRRAYSLNNVTIEPRQGYKILATTLGNENDIKILNIQNQEAIVLYINSYGFKGKIISNVKYQPFGQGTNKIFIIKTKDIIGNEIIIRDTNKEILLRYKIVR